MTVVWSPQMQAWIDEDRGARQEAARRAYIDRALPAAEALIARLISCGHA